MTDKLMITIMALAMIFLTHYAAFEFGRKNMCTQDKDYVFSYDYSKCIKIGKENLR